MGVPVRVFGKFIIVVGCFVISLIQSPYLASQTIPPITGRVVDAVTARPIQGISLTLQISTYAGLSVHTEVKSVASSDASGKFSLPGAKHPSGKETLGAPNGTEIPFDEFRAYWLTANEGFEATGQEQGSAEAEILFNPLLDPKWPVPNKRYFPLTITFPPLTIDPRFEECGRVWFASCIHIDAWSNITIPLVPVLNDPQGCNSITESFLRERCRQLNTYHAAFLHRASYEDMKIGKRLCEDLGQHGWIRDSCLSQLELHSETRAAEALPVPEGMFPDSIAGLLIQGKHCGPRLKFSGRVMCGAAYGNEAKVAVTPIATVQIEEFPEEEPSTKPPPWNPSFTDHNEAKITEESLGDGKVLRYKGPQFNSFYWHSGNRHVEVFFYQPIPQQEQLVSYYLKKLPSNFQ